VFPVKFTKSLRPPTAPKASMSRYRDSGRSRCRFGCDRVQRTSFWAEVAPTSVLRLGAHCFNSYPSGLSAVLCQPLWIALTAPSKASSLLETPFNIESGYVRPGTSGFLR
jgi:hypothetical protein